MLNRLAQLITRIISLFRICLACVSTSLMLHVVPRKHKRVAHFGLIGLIAYDLIHVGAKIADLGFLILAILLEAEDTAHNHDQTRGEK